MRHSIFYFLAILIIGASCQKDGRFPPSLQDQIQGNWKLESAEYSQDGSWVNAMNEFEGTTLEFNNDSLTWLNPALLEKGIGLFEIDTETKEINCYENEDGCEICDYETIHSLSAELSKLTPITQNYVIPIYVDLNSGETLTVNANKMDLHGARMTWRIWRNSKTYELSFIRP